MAVKALTEEQIQAFLEEGVLVVENFLSAEEVRVAMIGVSEALAKHGIQTDRLEETGHLLQSLSSTNGSGGVIDLFYEPFKIDVATNESLFRITSQLWEASIAHKGVALQDLPDSERFKWHPFGRFDPKIGYAYIDRLCYRLPSQLAERLGSKASGRTDSTSKRCSIQRSLTPHLDCCPDDRFRGKKWRPIQCFVSLTENVDQGTGGFEAARGFHRTFEEWAKNRPPSIISRSVRGHRQTVLVPAPCSGEYTHIRPREDRDVMQRIEHIPVPKGAAVFWDNRIPHSNAYRNDGNENLPRCVLYTSFLPDVEINRQYVKEQLVNMKMGKQPMDMWIDSESKTIEDENICREILAKLDVRQRQLLGVEPWPASQSHGTQSASNS
jgi:hypothetical protein